jgi:7-cyano-7-deazaguanine synthase
MDKAISMLSGGLDSTLSTEIAREHHNVSLAVTFDYGQRAASKEIKSTSKLCKNWKIEHRIIKLDFLSEIGKSALTHKTSALPQLSIEELNNDQLATAASAEQVWVPNRNGIFLNILAAIAEAENFQWIITGFNKEEAETFPDNSAHYIDLMNNCLTQSTLSQPQIVSYVKEMNKLDILKTAIEMKIDISQLWCCYDGKRKWCGKCESCMRTVRAMQKSKLFEKYKETFLNT